MATEPAPIVALRFRMPYPPRRKPAGRPKASVAERILARLQAEPEAVLRRNALAARVGVRADYLDAPLTALVLAGSIIELSAGFCLATPANQARLKAEVASRPARRGAQPLGELARRIVARAHDLRRHGRIGGATDLLERAGRQCRCPRISANFHVLADLFGDCLGPYRDVTRADATRIAHAAGVTAERFA
jgi:hypothetical protein